jgi:hypothetical protein
MIERYAEACSEVLYIVNNMSTVNKEKIPEKFIQFMEQNKSKNYEVPKQISLNNPEGMKSETKAILSVMYRNYFCREEERAKLKQEDDVAIRNRYSHENLFKNTKIQKAESYDDVMKNTTIKDTKALTKVDSKNEGIFGKIKMFITKIRTKLHK